MEGNETMGWPATVKTWNGLNWAGCFLVMEEREPGFRSGNMHCMLWGPRIECEILSQLLDIFQRKSLESFMHLCKEVASSRCGVILK